VKAAEFLAKAQILASRRTLSMTSFKTEGKNWNLAPLARLP
jgi:hypothetical protein